LHDLVVVRLGRYKGETVGTVSFPTSAYVTDGSRPKSELTSSASAPLSSAPDNHLSGCQLATNCAVVKELDRPAAIEGSFSIALLIGAAARECVSRHSAQATAVGLIANFRHHAASPTALDLQNYGLLVSAGTPRNSRSTEHGVSGDTSGGPHDIQTRLDDAGCCPACCR
jgi:hypothetical protein